LSGLAGSSINYVMQDKRGYLWFAAQQSGVSRFDGKNFRNFTKADGLISNDVGSICEDTHGNIWFSTLEGVSKFDGAHFTNYDNQSGLVNKEVNSIYCDKEGLLWFSTNGGLISYNPALSKKDSACFRSFNARDGLPEGNVYCMLENKEGYYWIGTSRGLYRFDGKKFKLFSEKNQISQSKIDNLMLDSKGQLWIGMQMEGIRVYDGKTFSKFELKEEVKNDRPYQIIEDKRGNIWMALEHGLLEYSARGQQIFTKRNGLNVDKVMSVCQDYEGTIWAGTFNGGASIFKGEAFVSFAEGEGLINNGVNSIIQDRHGNYFIATGEGLNCYNGQRMTPFRNVPELINCNVITMFIDSKGLIWIGTQDNGLIVLRYQDGTYRKDRVITKLDGITISTITRILEDQNKRIWFSCFGWGVFVLNGDRSFTHYMGGKELPGNNVTGLYLDKSGAVWIASLQGGVTLFKDNLFTTYNAKNGLPGNSVIPILESNGIMLFGTDEAGLVCFDPKAASDSARFTLISKKDGLSSNNITALLADGIGGIWVGTDKGLDKLLIGRNPVKLKAIKKYSEQKGYSIAEINPYGLYRDDKNKIWIGTIDGLLQYNPEMDFPSDVAPKMELTGIKLFYENVDWGKYTLKETGTMKSIGTMKGADWEKTDPATGLPLDLNLSYKNNNLTFVFQALTTGEVNYTYMLEGLDRSWSPPKSGTEAVYPNISPGHYTFKVQAINNDGLSSEKTISYSFTIIPPFYKTWWFYSVSALAISLFVFGFVRWRTKTLIKDKEKLEQVVLDRTAEVVRQKALIEIKNTEITDSINYAKRIQSAILPPLEEMNAFLPAFFVLFKPKDIVSGDFYWLGQYNSDIYIAAADCTGHGVPGGFMSMIGTDKLNEALKLTRDVSEMLSIVNKNLKKALRQSDKEGSTKDGMDIALCRLSYTQTGVVLEYAAANRPLWIIWGNKKPEIMETKATKMAVGGYTEDSQNFSKHSFELSKGDTFYIFSDGYADQFGEDTNKKMMTKKLKEALLSIHEKGMREQRILLNEIYEKWKGKMDQTDDVLMIGIRI